jgi:hypothetical protein
VLAPPRPSALEGTQIQELGVEVPGADYFGRMRVLALGDRLVLAAAGRPRRGAPPAMMRDDPSDEHLSAAVEKFLGSLRSKSAPIEK